MSPPPLRSPPRPRRTDRLLGLALALVVVAAAVGPTLPLLSRQLLGADLVDAHGTAWFYDMVDDALARDLPLHHTDRMFWPWGKDLHLHTGSNLLDALLAVPLRRVLGPVLGANLLWVLGLLATWLAARRLLRRVTSAPLAVEVVAPLLAFSPLALLELGEGRPTQAILLFPILLVEALWCTARRPGLGAPLAAGLLLALTGYQYWFHGFFAGILALGAGLAAVAAAPPGQRRAVLLRHALAAAVALLAVAPAVVPLVLGVGAGEVPGLLDTGAWSLAAQPLRTAEGQAVDLWTWQPLLGAVGFLANHPRGGVVFAPAAHPTPLPLLLALLAGLAVAGRGPRRALLAMLLPVGLLAVGPTLAVGPLGLPGLPSMALLELLPFARRLWWPGRALLVASVPAAVALALLLARARAWGPLPGRLLAVALVGAWLAQGRADRLLPLPTWDPTPPAGHRCLATGPQGAVLELPWGGSQRGLAWQSAHGRPLLGGMAERNDSLVPAQTLALLEHNGWLARLVHLTSHGVEARGPLDRPTQAAGERIRALGVTYVVLRRDELADHPRRDRALQRLLGSPVYQDARTVIYAPWGAPSPCQDTPPAPDLVSVPLSPGPRPHIPADDPRAHHLRAPWGG